MIACAQLAARESKPFALLPRRRGRVANHPLGPKSYDAHAAAGRPFDRVGQNSGEISDGPFHMDALRRQRQHQRRFAMPGVHRHPLFMRAELFFAVGHVEHVVGMAMKSRGAGAFPGRRSAGSAAGRRGR